MKKIYNFICILISAVLFLGSLNLTVLADDSVTNIAPQAAITSTGNIAEEHAKWVDNDYSGVGLINNAAMRDTVFVQFDYAKNVKVESIEVAFEKYDPDPNNFVFHYNLLGKKFDSAVWETIVTDATATRLTNGNIKTHALPAGTEYASIKMETTAIDKTGGNPYPAMNEFKIVGEIPSDYVNIAPMASISSTGGSANDHAAWVNNSYSGLGMINSAVMSAPVFAQFDYNGDAKVESIEVAFENLDPDTNNFVFRYNLLGQKFGETAWETIVSDVTATRLNNDNINTHKLPEIAEYASIRMDMTAIDRTGGSPWPAMAEFKIIGQLPEEIINPDPDNIAYLKPVHTNANRATAANITDNNLNNSWSAAYPGYADIDLGENYNLSSVEVFMPTSGYSQYSVYTSINGRDYDLLARKDGMSACPPTGDIYAAADKEARFVRVYSEYNSTNANGYLNEVKVRGTASGTPIQTTPAIDVEDYEDSEYAAAITAEDTIDEVRGIIERNIGADYVDWFDFVIAPNTANADCDYYEISDANGKIRITGNNGVSLATGLNHYLKYFCNVHISQVGNQVAMPESAPSVGETVRKETQFKLRYAYNYCTLSYTMAFWGEEEWRKELDWLALNGVTIVLDLTGQEEVWRRFLSELGYTHQETKDYLAGPAYYAWAYMQNMSGFGGPLHDSWFKDRTELARQNQRIMRTLGMQPILQGYSGMVPVDMVQHDGSLSASSVIAQGTWCGFTRPSMLRTDTAAYDEYAALFYQIQQEVYGDVSDYFATDPFHEGGNTGGMSQAVVSENVADALTTFKENSVWVIQSWGSNPNSQYMSGLTDYKDNILILDLEAEKNPRWENTSSYGGKEFGGSPWIYCMLSNFGGRMGLYGHLSNFAEGVPRAAGLAEHMKGIGITPEASQSNPILYDLFFETIWSDDPYNVAEIDIDSWIRDYTERRYGADSEAANEALQLYLETVYNSELNNIGQGAPESVINARPDLSISAASTWGNSVISYDKKTFEDAVRLLLADYDTLKDSDAYLYDVADALKQLLSNTAQEYHKQMAAAFNAGDIEKFNTESERFLELIDMVDRVLGTREEFMVGTWIGMAKDLASDTDDFTKSLYEFNARALITTWGAIGNANGGQLKDYSNRQWAGLTQDYYLPRWEKWIAERRKQLAGEDYETINWFNMEWPWTIGKNEYTTEANGEDLQALAEIIFENYLIEISPPEDDKKDIPLDGMTFEAGSYQPNEEIAKAFDDITNTMWHTNWNGAPREDHYAVIHLAAPETVDGLRYLPRQAGTNGIVTAYEIQVSRDNGVTYEPVASGTWAADSAWKLVTFEPQENVTDVKFISVASLSDTANRIFTSAAELRLTRPLDELVFTGEPVFNDGEGNSLESLTADEMNVTYVHQNETDDIQNLTMIVAVYTREGKLVHVGTDVKAAAGGDLTEYSVSLDMPGNIDGLYVTEGYTASVFLWASDSFVPIIGEMDFN